MGNLNSSSINAFLSVNDSSSRITAGSTLSGEIRCPDHSVSIDIFSGVKLYFIGKEDVEVHCENDSGKGGGLGWPKFKATTRDIVKTTIPLDTSKQSKQGVYPFTFHIPDHLPSSMYHEDGRGGYCSIRYKVKLHLMRGTDQEVPVQIMAKPPSTKPVPSLADPMPTRIAFMYCVPQGRITWAASADNTRVGIGDCLTVNLGMKNESSAKLERIEAKLEQVIEWQSSSHHSTSTNKSLIRCSSFEITEYMASKKKRSQELSPRSMSVYEEVLDTIQQGRNQVTFHIPDHLPQSYTGKLIRVRYYISIKAKTPFCYTSPKIHIPIQIVSPRSTPPLVTAQVVMPTAVPEVPIFCDEYDHSCAASGSYATAPYYDSYVFADVHPAVYCGGESTTHDSAEEKPLINNSDSETSSTPSISPNAFDTSPVNPDLVRSTEKMTLPY